MRKAFFVSMIFLLAGCPLLSAQNIGREPLPVPLTDTQILQKSICVKLEELLKFKGKAKFKEVGFGRGGPYHPWLAHLEAIRNARPKGFKSDLPIRLRIAPGELLQVGMEYMQNPKGSNYTKTILPEIKKTIDYEGYLSRKRVAGIKHRLSQDRTWKDKTGEFSVIARFVSHKDGIVTLQKSGENRITLPLAKLSDSDRKLILTAHPPAKDSEQGNVGVGGTAGQNADAIDQ